MRKASPAVLIFDLSKANIAAAEAVPATSADFVDIETSAIDTRGGMVAPAAITNAAIPNWQHYDTGRFLFSPLTVTGDLEGLTVTLWGIDAQGSPMALGRSELTAEGTLQPITGVPIYARMKYALQVSSVAYAATGTVTFVTFAQGYYKDADDA